MRNYLRDVDFDKYHTFFLEYYKDGDTFSTHTVRPCTATYEEISDTKRNRSFMIEGAIASYDKNTTISEIMLDCSVRGVSIDFVDILIKKDDKRWGEHKVVRVIDTHKEEIDNIVNETEASRFYVSLNRNKKDILKFLVIDRFAQDSKIDFIHGEYDRKSVIAGFKEYDDALKFCNESNNN